MDAQLLEEYRRIRRENPYYPARAAVELARWYRKEPALPLGAYDDEWSVELERDGFKLKVRADYDYDYNVSDYLGSFAKESGHYDKNTRQYVEHELNPRAWSRGEIVDHDYYPYVDLADGFRYRDEYNYARGAGMSRSVADDYARARVREDVARLTSDSTTAVYIVVRAYFRGIELGAASLYGIELSEDDYRANARYMSDSSEELISEALHIARENLEELRKREELERVQILARVAAESEEYRRGYADGYDFAQSEHNL